MLRNIFTEGNFKCKEVKKMKKIAIFTLLFVTMVLPVVITDAFADPYPLVPDAYNGLFFNNAEVLLDNDGDGAVSVGDTFWGTVQLNQIKGPTGPEGQAGPSIWFPGGGFGIAEVTGYFATDVVAVYAPGTLAPPNHPLSASSATLATIILGTPAVDPNGILSAGEILRIYEQNVVNYDDSSQALALSTGTDGVLTQILGLTGGYWYTLAPLVPPGAGDVGESFAGLNFLMPLGAFTMINDPNEDYSSNAGVVGGLNVGLFFNSELISFGTFGTPAGAIQMHFGSNDPAVVKPIPEPSTIMLLGAGLVGVATLIRRRM